MILEGGLDVFWTPALKRMSGSLLVFCEGSVAGYKDRLLPTNKARVKERLGESGINFHEICKVRELGVG